jgi:dTMP kinase
VQAGRAGRPASQLLQPTVTLWFDLAPEIAAQRLAGARVPDKFEAQPVEFFRRVAQGYADRARPMRGASCASMPSQARDQVWQQVEAALVARGVFAGAAR